jgi:hypothetical protein
VPPSEVAPGVQRPRAARAAQREVQRHEREAQQGDADRLRRLVGWSGRAPGGVLPIDLGGFGAHTICKASVDLKVDYASYVTRRT